MQLRVVNVGHAGHISQIVSGILYPVQIAADCLRLVQVGPRQGGKAKNRVERRPHVGTNQYGVYQFAVEDTGVGIEPDFLTHIFEPFAREQNTTLSGIHGAGLGCTGAPPVFLDWSPSRTAPRAC